MILPQQRETRLDVRLFWKKQDVILECFTQSIGLQLG